MKHNSRDKAPPAAIRSRQPRPVKTKDAGEVALGALEGIARANGDFVSGLEHGIRVMEAFSRDHPELTLSEVASLTALSPATARRALFTLEALGYIGRVDRKFLLRVKVLALTSAYLTAIDAQVVLQPFLQGLVDEVGGSSSVTVLSDLDILYVAHASRNRTIRLSAGVGTRYPAYATAMGRVLLAFQSPAVIDSYFRQATLVKLTDNTEVNQRRLRAILADVRAKGYAAIQDELDYGLVSVAVPIMGPNGAIVAAANCSDVISRLDINALVRSRLTPLRGAAQRIQASVAKYPVLAHSVLGSGPSAQPPKLEAR